MIKSRTYAIVGIGISTRVTPENSGKSGAELDKYKYFLRVAPDKGGNEGTGKVYQGNSRRRT